MKRASTVDGLKRGVGTAAAGTVGGSTAEPLPTAPAEAPQRMRPEKPKPVRFTLDLDRARHQYLKSYAAEIDDDASKVMRALLDELHDDPELAARVRARVWGAEQ